MWIVCLAMPNISENTQEIPQGHMKLSTLQRQKKYVTNKNITNATYETTDAQTKRNCKCLETVSRKTTGALEPIVTVKK